MNTNVRTRRIYRAFVLTKSFCLFFFKNIHFMKNKPKLDLKFIDADCENTFIKVEVSKCGERVLISGNTYGENFGIFLDRSTAIKFNRVMRNEISQINIKNV